MTPTKKERERFKEHHDNPKNNSALKNYNARGIGKNPDNFGEVDMYMLIDKDEKILDIGYEYKGCPSIEFTASVFSQELKGEYLKDAIETTQEFLDEMNADEDSDDCMKMILVALISASKNYEIRQNGIKLDYAIEYVKLKKHRS